MSNQTSEQDYQPEEETALEDIELDALDVKAASVFPGKIVRKDLVKTMKAGENVPVYVLEYLLGKYCSSTDPRVVREGLQMVKDVVSERFCRADESELIKARAHQQGSVRLIDRVTVTFTETQEKYWASLSNSGLTHVNVDEGLVRKYERLLAGGIWANVEIRYDSSLQHGGQLRPFVIDKLQPIQIATVKIEEFLEARRKFTREEWIDLLVRSMGYEPTSQWLTPRLKLLYLTRLVPMVQNNFNLIELGPRSTGKSFIYRELSPYVILVSGGQVTVPKLFVSNSPPYRVGLVGLWDVVAFDEVAGTQFKKLGDRQIYKDYMELGSFSRGSEKGTIQAYASFVFNGNIDGDVETIAKTTHLLSQLPDPIRNDMAFHDRWHAYLPGWELPKMQPGLFTRHMGFISDYISECFRELRSRNFADAFDKYFKYGSHVEERDLRAIRRTVSGLVKLLHPNGRFEKADVEEYLALAIELRRRVKEQLKRMGGIEFSRTSLSYIDIHSGEETVIPCPELGAIQLIPESRLTPGDVFTIGMDREGARYGLFRIQVTCSRGTGRCRTTGATSRAMRDSVQTAYDYLKVHLKDLGIEKSLKEYDFHVQIVNMMQAKEGAQAGIAVFISLLSALLNRPLTPQLAILGDMSLHGVLVRVGALADRLKIAMDAGARKVMIPVENKRDFADLPGDIIDKLQIIFYSDPVNAALKAMQTE
jgi:ATP-dependent Lon protease